MRGPAIATVLLLCGLAGLAAWLEWGGDEASPRAAAIVAIPPAGNAAHGTRPGDTPGTRPGEERPKLVYFDPSLVEDSSHGPIPRIGPNGRRPAEVYARPFTAEGRPRVAVIVTGLGLKAELTETALKALPASVTLAFSPYAPNLYDWTRAARTAGHEVMIEAPMEPRDAARDDAGPKALLASLSGTQNRARLHWTLSRFVGYVGVIGPRNEGLSAKPDAFVPLVDDLLGRGLLYVHPESDAPALAAIGRDRGLLHVDLWLDEAREPEAIERRMRIAEALARGRGWVVVAARAIPLTIDSVRQWAAALPDREMAPAPISAVTHDALAQSRTP